MPKAIKGNASRKPPEPATNHSDIDDWFWRQMPHLQPIVKRLDETIRATIPGLHYAVKWKRPYYGLPELGWVIEMAAYDGATPLHAGDSMRWGSVRSCFSRWVAREGSIGGADRQRKDWIQGGAR
jgi:hypothetical protein